MLKYVLVISLVLALLMAGCGGPQKEKTSSEPSKSDKNLTWSMSVTTSESSSWYKGAKKFADLVKERTNGRITINVFPNEQLSGGDLTKGIEMVQTGATEIDLHSTMIWSVVEPKMSVISLPFLFDNTEEVDKALSGAPGEMLARALEAKNVHFLAWGENGFRQITTGKKPIRKPEDLKGLKIRVPPISILMTVYKTLGADPTVMNFGEVFTALQQGAIDGQENPIGVIYSGKIHEVQKYLTNWNYCYDALALVINQRLWNSLDQNTQKIIAESAKEAMAYQRQINREEVASLIKEMQNKGLTIIDLTPEEKQAFVQALKPVYQQAEKTVGKDIIDMFLTMQ